MNICLRATHHRLPAQPSTSMSRRIPICAWKTGVTAPTVNNVSPSLEHGPTGATPPRRPGSWSVSRAQPDQWRAVDECRADRCRQHRGKRDLPHQMTGWPDGGVYQVQVTTDRKTTFLSTIRWAMRCEANNTSTTTFQISVTSTSAFRASRRRRPSDRRGTLRFWLDRHRHATPEHEHAALPVCG